MSGENKVFINLARGKRQKKKKKASKVPVDHAEASIHDSSFGPWQDFDRK